MKLNIKSFSITCGLFFGLGLFLLTWWIIMIEGASGEPTLIGKVYRGYSISFIGSCIGFLWAFVDGIVGGAIFAWIYNKLSTKFTSS